MSEAACQPVCAPACPMDWVFDRVRVYPSIAQGTQVQWQLHPQFADPGPYTFQLQVGRTALTEADDWQPVGLPADNTYYLLDDSPRVRGKTQWTHYRVCLSTPLGLYFSAPQHCLGDLSPRDFRIAQATIRNESLMLRKRTGTEGFLLKRRLYGTPCPVPHTYDSLQDVVTNPQCEVCWGSGFVAGYFDPLPCVYAAVDEKVFREQLDGVTARQTINDLVCRARMLAEPQLMDSDIWIAKHSDLRYVVHQIRTAVEIRGVPVVYYPVELRQLPFTHPVYRIPIPGQLP